MAECGYDNHTLGIALSLKWPTNLRSMLWTDKRWLNKRIPVLQTYFAVHEQWWLFFGWSCSIEPGAAVDGLKLRSLARLGALLEASEAHNAVYSTGRAVSRRVIQATCTPNAIACHLLSTMLCWYRYLTFDWKLACKHGWLLLEAIFQHLKKRFSGFDSK